MSMEIAGYVGPRTAADGTLTTMRLGKDASQVVQDGHGRYQEPVLRGGVYSAANQASQALSLFNTTTSTGLILTNPLGSGKNLVLLEVIAFISAAITAVASVVLAGSTAVTATAVTHTTPITPRNNLIGGAAGVGLVDSAATVSATPVILRELFGWHWVTAGTPAAQLGVKDIVDGAIILPPGTYVQLASVTAAHSVIGSFTWEEIPV